MRKLPWILLCVMVLAYSLAKHYQPEPPSSEAIASDRELSLSPTMEGKAVTRPEDSLQVAAPADQDADNPFDLVLGEYEKQIANLRDGEFEYLASHALTMEEQILLRNSTHLEIQANIATLLGNAVEFDEIPKTDLFVERQKLAWTYGLDAYRAINFIEQNQYGRLLSAVEIEGEMADEGFQALRQGFADDYPELSDEKRAELYQRVLDARSDPSLSDYQEPELLP